MRARLTSLALVATFACGGGDDDGTGPVMLFAEPGAIDFGTVEVGKSATSQIVLRNLFETAFEIESVKLRPLDQLTFDFSVDQMSIAAGGTAQLSVTYHPVGAGSSMVEVVVKPKGSDEVALAITGTAVEPAILRVTPTRVSFGEVAVGSSSMMTANVTNRNATPGVVTFDPGLNVDVCGAQGSDNNNFCLTFVGKTLDGERFGIEGNETVEITVRFIPLDPGIAESASFDLRTCPMSECEVSVELDGSGAP